jgi:hypothetical protein
LLNPLIARHTLPYLTISALLRLAATSKSFRDLIYHDGTIFKYLDLSTAKGAVVDFEPIDRGGINWRSQRMDEGVTEEDFYCGPLRGIFASLRRCSLLQHVQTLVLDGQAAPAEVLHEVISEDKYNVRILSVIGSTHLNEAKFRKTLQYAVRPTRPEGTPRLQGVYIFGAESPLLDRPRRGSWPSNQPLETTSLGNSWNRRSRDALTASLEQNCDSWYAGPGRVLPKTWGKRSKDLDEWAYILKACEGIIAFDAVLCQGPKHFLVTKDADGDIVCQDYLHASIASIAVDGCEKCGKMPEGPVYPRDAPSSRLPLLSPPPRHTTSIARAQQPLIGERRELDIPLYARCTNCLVPRCCESCFTFWCEDCYDDDALRIQQANNRIGWLQQELQRARELLARAEGAVDEASFQSPKAPGTKVRTCRPL